MVPYQPGPYLSKVFTDSEWRTVDRKLNALSTIGGVSALITEILNDPHRIPEIHAHVRDCVILATCEDIAGVWRRRGAGAWSYVRDVCLGLGKPALHPSGQNQPLRIQIEHVIAEALCDVEIADQSGSDRQDPKPTDEWAGA